MTKQLEHASQHDRFQHLLKMFSSERFLNREGLGNEVPFFICPFPSVEAKDFDDLISKLTNRLNQDGIKPLEINLYDLCITLLDGEGDLQWILEEEPSQQKDKLLNELRAMLDIERHLIPAIEAAMKQSDGFQLLFLTGIGEVYPYIRAHNVLNNLQRIAKDQPTVLFFPGTYTHSLEKGASLELFGRLRDDRYYRAFNVFDREV